jgi:hypothetical protein
VEKINYTKKKLMLMDVSVDPNNIFKFRYYIHELKNKGFFVWKNKDTDDVQLSLTRKKYYTNIYGHIKLNFSIINYNFLNT